MTYVVDENRPSDSPFAEMIWHMQSAAGGTFISAADTHVGVIVTKQQDKTTFTVLGPETKASPAPIPENAEWIGIIFKHGTFIPSLSSRELVNGGIHLPQAAGQSFWLDSTNWEFPTYENADTFIARLVRAGLLAHEPIVEAALQGHVKDLSVRSVQRRFLRATGMTHGTMYQIQRAHRAMSLLQQGISILDTVDQAGYADQSHLTRSLKHLIGQTPAQILDIRKQE